MAWNIMESYYGMVASQHTKKKPAFSWNQETCNSSYPVYFLEGIWTVFVAYQCLSSYYYNIFIYHVNMLHQNHVINLWTWQFL